MARVAGGLALCLVLWLGVLAPVQAVVCEHDRMHAGVAHERGLCAWFCASHDGSAPLGGAGHAVFADAETLCAGGPLCPVVAPDEESRGARAPPSVG